MKKSLGCVSGGEKLRRENKAEFKEDVISLLFDLACSY